MSKMKRFLAVLIAGLFVLTMIVGCGAENGSTGTEKTTGVTNTESGTTASESTEAKPEPVTVTWLGAVNSKDITTGIVHNAVFDAITEKTGVTIDHTPTLGVSDLNTQISVLLAGGDLPDVVTLTDAKAIPQVLTAGAAIPLDDLLKTNGANLAKNAADMIKMSKLTIDPSHKLYVLRSQAGTDGKGDALGDTMTWNVRWDLYRKLGFPKINTYDDLLKLGADMLKLEPTNADGKKNYAFGVPLGDTWTYLIMVNPALSSAGLRCFKIEMAIDAATDQVVPVISNPDSPFWEVVGAMNKAYRMGIFDPESATLKLQSFMDKAKTGRYMIAENNWMLGLAKDEFKAQGHSEKGYMPVVLGEIKPTSYFSVASADGNQYCTFITKNCKNPERVMDLLNFLATPEGVELVVYGIEGTHWMVDPKDSGYLDETQAFKDEVKKDSDYRIKQGITMLYNIMPVSNHGVKDERGFAIYDKFDINLDDPDEYQHRKDFCTDMNVKYPAQILDQTPHLASYANNLFGGITMVNGSDVADKATKIEAYVPTAIAKAIFQESEEGFNKQKQELIKTCNDMGVQAVIDYYKEQYEARKKEIASME